MARFIPGVEIAVVKEIVPRAANPAGIVGLLGITDRGPSSGARVGDWNQFIDIFGRASAYSLPEAKQIIENGAFEMVVVPVVTNADRATTLVDGAAGSPVALLRARAAGSRMNDALSAEITNLRNAGDPANALFDMAIRFGDAQEVYRNLQMADPDGTGYMPTTINNNSALVVALPTGTLEGVVDGQTVDFAAAGEQKLLTQAAPPDPATFTGIALTWQNATPGRVTVEIPAGALTFNLLVHVADQLVERFDGLTLSADPQPDGTHAILSALSDSSNVTAQMWKAIADTVPKEGKYTFDGGTEPPASAYDDALQLLTSHADIDLVVAGMFGDDSARFTSVYASVAAHCNQMSGDAKNRIGFGGAPRGHSVADIVDMAALFNSERFVLVAPAEVVGSVVGRIAKLDYFRSPTFKTLSGVTGLSSDYLPTDLRTLLRANVLPVDLDRQLGFIVVKGITTSGEQISVTRVQDHSVRAVKRIANLFIGKLNNQMARLALRQKLSEYFQQMEKDGAIVPSTDGTDPSYKVDVYSSQADFAQGRVRVDIAVRPVRAIDYVTATILVQA